MKPYPVSYRAIIPRAEECENLWMPPALSAIDDRVAPREIFTGKMLCALANPR